MASIYPHGAGFRAQLYFRGRTVRLWLGRCSKTQATYAAAHLEQLKIARNSGSQPPEATRLWLANLSQSTKKQLEAFGLIDPQPNSKFRRTLGDFCADYVKSRSDWKENTTKRMSNVRRHLIAEIGTDKLLTQITPGDAKRFSRWARENFSHSHSGKLIRDANQLFAAAVDERILTENPFAGINSSQRHDKTREATVPRETIEKLIAKADPYYQAVIAASRYAGLRSPSELRCLRWQTIDFDTGRMVVNSPKTGLRECPIFADFRPYLDALYHAAPPGSLGPFMRHSTKTGAATRHRKEMERLSKLTGVKLWPKLWHNCRASFRRDLLDDFPEHVVNAWLGHDSEVAARHYSRITTEDFEKAIKPRKEESEAEATTEEA